MKIFYIKHEFVFISMYYLYFIKMQTISKMHSVAAQNIANSTHLEENVVVKDIVKDFSFKVETEITKHLKNELEALFYM